MAKYSICDELLKEDEKIYVTYGFGNTFDINKVKGKMSLEESIIGKPTRCFWGSPIDARFGWKNWCLCENYLSEDTFVDSNKILWKLSPESEVLCIRNYDDILKCVKNHLIYVDEFNWPHTNFLRIKLEGYDAVELFSSCIGSGFREYESVFYGWDCESIVVLNPDKIIQVKEN